MKKIFLFAFIASIASLGAALTAEYGFGLKPCELCMMQRVPYALVIIISLLALILPMPHYQRYLVYVIAVIFVAGGSIATYHSAVEKHLIKGPDACSTSGTMAGQSVDELLKKIQNAPIVACDQPAWEYHSITMAIINALWSFALGAIMVKWIRYRKNA